MPKGISEYKVLDKLKTALAPIVLNYREALKFIVIKDKSLENLSKLYDALEARLNEIDK